MNRKRINAYDFDGTIYDGDSSIDFYRFCIRMHPGIIAYLPRQVFGLIRYSLRMITKTQCKESFFCFLDGIKDIDLVVLKFWEANEKRIFKYYMNQRTECDVVISASPEFLLKHICEKLKVSYICSRVEKHTGVFEGKNCYGEEKVKRLHEEYGEDIWVENFYSDSLSDYPMASISKHAYLIINKHPVEWNKKRM